MYVCTYIYICVYIYKSLSVTLCLSLSLSVSLHCSVSLPKGCSHGDMRIQICTWIYINHTCIHLETRKRTYAHPHAHTRKFWLIYVCDCQRGLCYSVCIILAHQTTSVDTLSPPDALLRRDCSCPDDVVSVTIISSDGAVSSSLSSLSTSAASSPAHTNSMSCKEWLWKVWLTPQKFGPHCCLTSFKHKRLYHRHLYSQWAMQDASLLSISFFLSLHNPISNSRVYSRGNSRRQEGPMQGGVRRPQSPNHFRLSWSSQYYFCTTRQVKPQGLRTADNHSEKYPVALQGIVCLFVCLCVALFYWSEGEED